MGMTGGRIAGAALWGPSTSTEVSSMRAGASEVAVTESVFTHIVAEAGGAILNQSLLRPRMVTDPPRGMRPTSGSIGPGVERMRPVVTVTTPLLTESEKIHRSTHAGTATCTQPCGALDALRTSITVPTGRVAAFLVSSGLA